MSMNSFMRICLIVRETFGEYDDFLDDLKGLPGSVRDQLLDSVSNYNIV